MAGNLAAACVASAVASAAAATTATGAAAAAATTAAAAAGAAAPAGGTGAGRHAPVVASAASAAPDVERLRGRDACAHAVLVGIARDARAAAARAAAACTTAACTAAASTAASPFCFAVRACRGVVPSGAARLLSKDHEARSAAGAECSRDPERSGEKRSREPSTDRSTHWNFSFAAEGYPCPSIHHTRHGGRRLCVCRRSAILKENACRVGWSLSRRLAAGSVGLLAATGRGRSSRDGWPYRTASHRKLAIGRNEDGLR